MSQSLEQWQDHFSKLVQIPGKDNEYYESFQALEHDAKHVFNPRLDYDLVNVKYTALLMFHNHEMKRLNREVTKEYNKGFDAGEQSYLHQ